MTVPERDLPLWDNLRSAGKTAREAANIIRESMGHYPVCRVPLPWEPGPMCGRPSGHTGPHVSPSGLWRWDDGKPLTHEEMLGE